MKMVALPLIMPGITRWDTTSHRQKMVRLLNWVAISMEQKQSISGIRIQGRCWLKPRLHPQTAGVIRALHLLLYSQGKITQLRSILAEVGVVTVTILPSFRKPTVI